jgi:transposase InsO family protein
VLARARKQEFSVRKSTNRRYRCLAHGIRRLVKVERELELRLARRARRYNKLYPGEMIHLDTKRLPLLTGETNKSPREYLFIAIDDYSRELFVAIMPDKSQYSAAKFAVQVIEECPYTIECLYSDNGTEYKGSATHALVRLCAEHGIAQRFTRPRRPQTNGKAERVIRTIMEMWHQQNLFSDRSERKRSLLRFVNYYNAVKPHKGIAGATPYEQLLDYFYPEQ